MGHGRVFILMWIVFICISIIVYLWSLSSISKPRFQFIQVGHKPENPHIICSAATLDQKVGVSALVNKSATPKLLLFHSFPYYYELEKATGTSIFSSCENKCELSVNTSRFTEADAIVFYSHNTNVWKFQTPDKRSGQIWTLFSVESPIYSNNAIFGEPPWHRMFNWTMTYRRDSELWHGYVRTVPRSVPVSQEIRLKDEQRWRALFVKKTKMVAWFVSHCQTDSRREEYVAILSKYISIDIYGSCGQMKCDDRPKCFEMLSTDYKFYLAFENSLCLDYVTEKLKSILDLNTLIPVVRGGANYHKMFPARSVIDTRDFPSPKHLADYLLDLANDENAYIKFLQWSWEHEVKGPDLPVCQLCNRVHQQHQKLCFYDDVYAWWSLNNCQKVTDLV